MRILVAAACSLAAAGCASGAPPSSESSGSSSATSFVGSTVVDPADATSSGAEAVSEPTLPNGLLDLQPLRAEFEELPVGGFEDGGCTFMTPRDLISAPLVFRGDVVSVSDRGEYPGLGGAGTVVGRMVEFDVSEVIVDVDGVAADADRLWLVTSEARIEGDTRYDAMDFLADVDPRGVDVLAVGYNPANPPTGRVPQLAHAIVDDDGSTRLDGNCSYLGEQVDWVAERLGDSSGHEMLARVASLQADGESLVALDEATLAWQNRHASPPWEQQDQQQRSMVPSAVPADLRGSVDVTGVWVALDDAPGAVFARTNSGMSSPGLSAGVLPGAMPLYFFDTDTTIEIVMSRVDEPTDFTVIATLAVGQIIGQGGIEVTGSVQRQDVTATILSRREFAERMSIDETQLDSLRDSFLSL